MASFYWERHPDGPFATLIAVATTYLSPEGYDLESLQRLAKRQDDEKVREFKTEPRAAIADPSQLPGDELSESVEYDDGSDEAFLRHLWHDLYGDEPLNAPRALFDPDPEFAALGTTDLLAIVPRPGKSVLLIGRALMELGRRSSSEPAPLGQVADMIRDPQNRRLTTIGTVSISQLGTAATPDFRYPRHDVRPLESAGVEYRRAAAMAWVAKRSAVIEHDRLLASDGSSIRDCSHLGLPHGS